MENIDLFDRYRKNELEPKEKLDFEKNLQSNSALHAEFEHFKLAADLIKFEHLRKDVKNFHSNYRKRSVFQLPLLKYAAILVFGVSIFSSYYTLNLKSQDLLSSSHMTYQVSLSRGNETEITEYEQHYQKTEYEELIKKYENKRAISNKQLFITAMSYYNLKKYDKSLKILQNLKPINNEYKHEIPFYIGQNLVGLNKPQEALEIFSNMNDENPYKKAINASYKFKLKLLAFKSRF